jgi:hypothetical protein
MITRHLESVLMDRLSDFAAVALVDATSRFLNVN